MLTIEVFDGTGTPAEAAVIRNDVFVIEQGFSEEFDGIDAHAVHVLVRDDGVPIATGRLFCEEGSEWHIGRVAVVASRRTDGVGRVVMDALEAEARKRGAETVILGAQMRASGFYEKLGYKEFGEPHYEDYCPHIHMRKNLK